MSVPAAAGWEVRLVNLNDGSVEGLAHRDLPGADRSISSRIFPGTAG